MATSLSIGLGPAVDDVALDHSANKANGPRLSTTASRAAAWAIPTNEELMIARQTRRLPTHKGWPCREDCTHRGF